MEKKKAKVGMSAMLIVAIVFIGMGITFLPIGIVAYVANWNVEGNLIVFSTVFGGVGALFLALGILFLVLTINNGKRCNRLLQDGYYITTQVVAIDRNWNVTYGRYGHPFVIKSNFVDYNGTIHIFKSRNITRYPGSGLEGQMVKVYLDRNAPENYKYYYMDVDEILPNVVEH